MKKIWITGASSGIGKALAIKFANADWKVAASARRENLLKELSDKYTNFNIFKFFKNIFKYRFAFIAISNIQRKWLYIWIFFI